MADSAHPLNRRAFLVTSGLATATVAATTVLPGTAHGVAHAAPGTKSRELPGDPFTLGVASGDPDPDGFVLWTRLAPPPSLMTRLRT